MNIFKAGLPRATPFETIQRQSFPYLVLSANTQPLSWVHGTLLTHRLKSTFIRITARGVNFYTRNDVSIDESAWEKVTCIPSDTALCLEDNPSAMLYFDTGEIDVPDDWNTLMQTRNIFLDKFPNGTSCSSDYTGRTLKIGDSRYELSLCDLLDNNLDILFQPHTNTLYWRVNAMQMWEYVGIAFIAVYLIACLSHNLVTLLTNSEKAQERKLMQLIVVSLVLLYCLVYVVWGVCHGSACAGTHLVTTSDLAVTAHLLTLGIIDTCFLFFYKTRVRMDHASNISLLTSCLLLLLVRVYDTMDTPYISVLSCFFGTRSVYKLLVVMNETSTQTERVMQMLDAFVFASLLGNGVWYANDTSIEAGIAQGQILLLASLAGLFLYTFKILNSKLE